MLSLAGRLPKRRLRGQSPGGRNAAPTALRQRGLRRGGDAAAKALVALLVQQGREPPDRRAQPSGARLAVAEQQPRLVPPRPRQGPLRLWQHQPVHVPRLPPPGPLPRRRTPRFVFLIDQK